MFRLYTHREPNFPMTLRKRSKTLACGSFQKGSEARMAAPSALVRGTPLKPSRSSRSRAYASIVRTRYPPQTCSAQPSGTCSLSLNCSSSSSLPMATPMTCSRPSIRSRLMTPAQSALSASSSQEICAPTRTFMPVFRTMSARASHTAWRRDSGQLSSQALKRRMEDTGVSVLGQTDGVSAGHPRRVSSSTARPLPLLTATGPSWRSLTQR
mmetsp:Transcript_46443/g.145428  ORF Transcript_46443/g.145428 Transcript_46443/m.145428 type:complete len:211 (-) Transcript_46443:132-764(-)